MAEDVKVFLSQEIDRLKRIEATPKEVTNTTKDQIALRGGLADRLANTPHEADVNKRVDDIRLGSAELNAEDNEVINKMIHDMMDHILSGGA